MSVRDRLIAYLEGRSMALAREVRARGEVGAGANAEPRAWSVVGNHVSHSGDAAAVTIGDELAGGDATALAADEVVRASAENALVREFLDDLYKPDPLAQEVVVLRARIDELEDELDDWRAGQGIEADPDG